MTALPAGWVSRDFPVPQAPSREFLARSAAARVGPPIRYAATVELVRDGEAGLEVFVMRRHPAMAFAAQMVVFPGGRIDEQDGDPSLPVRGRLPSAAFGVSVERARAIVAAAVREVIEETGVWLTVDADGLPAAPSVAQTAVLRERLERGEVALAAVLTELGLTIDADLLAPQGNWITPASESRRYDTAFLVAAMPPGQVVQEVSGEADDAGWARPGDLLAGFALGRVRLLPPTQVTLEQLARFPDVASVLAGSHAIRPIAPELVARADGQVVLRATVPRTELP